jgi:membrane protein implicated in regulation of membrane protease activity
MAAKRGNARVADLEERESVAESAFWSAGVLLLLVVIAMAVGGWRFIRPMLDPPSNTTSPARASQPAR